MEYTRQNHIIRDRENGRIIGTIRRSVMQIIEEFWSRVRILSPDECWEWQASFHNQLMPYGILWANGIKWKAHRFSYRLHYGSIPDGLYVCHSCDNPPCVNPYHLFLGTAKDNMDDCISKGRLRRERGEERYNCKLSETKVKEIRFRWIFGAMPAQLSREYGVYDTMIHSIIRRLRWKHVR